MGIVNLDKLSESDKELFRKSIQELLRRTFIVENRYHKDKNLYRDYVYTFIEEHESLLMEYLKFSGFELMNDNNNGVYYIRSESFNSNLRFSKVTTIFLLLIRLLYEEKQESVNIGRFINFQLSELLNKVEVFHLSKNLVADTKIKESLKILSKYNFIEKINSSYEDTASIYVIYPSILHCIDGNIVKNILDEFKKTSKNNEMVVYK